jgi:hypothetical protein
MWNFQELKTPHDLQRRRAKHQKLKISSFSPSSKLKREKLYKDCGQCSSTVYCINWDTLNYAEITDIN